jgi:ATP-dependent RNA circularization protein (DNA/RNA ligase family)
VALSLSGRAEISKISYTGSIPVNAIYKKVTMFKKYEKTFRIKISEFNVPGKFYLSDPDIKDLLSGPVIIEEKMDGANFGIIRHKKGYSLQKRGSLVGPSEHEQFQFYHNWAAKNYDKIMQIPQTWILYGELMYACHNIFYNKLPDYVLIFDVWDGKKFLQYKERKQICDKWGFVMVPMIHEGIITKNSIYSYMPQVSLYGDRAEGIVIKRYRKNGFYLRGKVVWPDFMKEIDESDHWMHKKIRVNKLA